jgi:hypothetical protein
MDKRWNCRALMAAAVLALGSCERPLGPPSPGQLALQVVSGDQQRGEAGQELAQPLVVKVTRANGSSVRGQILNFRVVSGGGSVFGGTEITDNSGMAQELWTLGTQAGEPQRIEVRAVDPQTGEPQTFGAFTATAVAGPPARMTTLSGDGQQVEPGQTVPIPPSVKLEDQYGNPTANVGVAFTVVRGSVTNGDAVTNANGVATVGSWTVGTETTTDTLVARANPTGVSGNPALFFAVVRPCDCWTTKASLGTARWRGALGAINGRLYAVGGYTGEGYPLSIEEYDPSSDRWAAVGDAMPHGRFGMGYASLNGLLYVAGGFNPSFYPESTLDAFDPATGHWTLVSHLPTVRQYLGAGTINGILYFVGGSRPDPRGVSMSSVLEAYDPATATWSRKAFMRTPRQYVAVANLNGILYVIGGDAGGGYSGALSVVEAYDPTTDAWTTKSPLPQGRSAPVAEVVNGVLYVVGGKNINTEYQKTVYAYDSIHDTWIQKSDMPTARDGAASSVLNGLLYVVGGFFQRTVEAYKP